MFNILIIASALLGGLGQAHPIQSEVGFAGAGGIKLTGTLELPGKGPSKYPAILLIPGSGPTDRDGNSPALPDLKVDILKEIADRLAAQGIATYRFDKRALARYRALCPKDLQAIGEFFSFDHFAGDAEAAFKMLQSRPEVDPSRVGVLGHSEGATWALKIGADLHPKIVILLGGLGRKMGENLHEQIEYRLNQQAPAFTKSYVAYTDAACEAMAAGKPLPPNPPQGLGSLFNVTTTNLLGGMCRLDPLDLVKQYDGPMLALNGANDQQVSPKKDFPRLLAGMQARPRCISEGHLVPQASHCLKHTATPTEDAFTGPVVPDAMKTILGFAAKYL